MVVRTIYENDHCFDSIDRDTEEQFIGCFQGYQIEMYQRNISWHLEWDPDHYGYFTEIKSPSDELVFYDLIDSDLECSLEEVIRHINDHRKQPL